MLGRRLFIFLYMVSGAAALVYEVVWTRLLTLQLGHTVAATSTVLAAFMGGLAVGAWAAGRLCHERALTTSGEPMPRSRRFARNWTAVPYLQIYAALEIGIGAYALLLPAML